MEGLKVLGFCAAGALAAGAPFTQKEMSAMFYADLGPEEIDVASYPPQQRQAYELFRAKCSQCHTLARAVNSPLASREGWKSYIGEMRLRSGIKPSKALTQDEAKTLVDFLAYDGQKRKIEKRGEFDVLTRRLQKRFWETIAERLNRMQKGARPVP